MFCWTVAAGSTLALINIEGIKGYWELEEDVDAVAICWVSSAERRHKGPVASAFIFLYPPPTGASLHLLCGASHDEN